MLANAVSYTLGATACDGWHVVAHPERTGVITSFRSEADALEYADRLKAKYGACAAPAHVDELPTVTG